jgi:hypothetical protein
VDTGSRKENASKQKARTPAAALARFATVMQKMQAQRTHF